MSEERTLSAKEQQGSPSFLILTYLQLLSYRATVLCKKYRRIGSIYR